MFQGFEDNGKFYFHESGLRMGGEQFYIFAEKLNNISSLNMMIEFALTGKMESCNALELDNYKFSQYCCNYYVALKAGTITKIEGNEEVNKMPQVLQNLQFKYVGNEISKTSSLDRVIFRIHVMAPTKEEFIKSLCEISDTLKIYDEYGNEMQLEHLTYENVKQRVDSSWC